MNKNLVGVLGALLLAGNSLQAVPSQVKDVNVVNSPSVSVANTPTVNVGNTPTVTVGNTPTVNVGNTPTVNISNTATQPVVTSAIDTPGRIAYQSQVSNSTGSCSGTGTCFLEFPSVPAGHRVVIQHISGIVSFSTTANAVWVQLNNGSGAPVSTFFTPLTPFTSFSAFDQSVQAYFDPAQFGGVIEVQLSIIGGTFPGAGSPETITLSGYELDCSATPCAPIAH
jgi:hypothetical protein